MNLFDFLFKKNTSLSRMTRAQLRRQEILLDKERERIARRIQKISDDKQSLFQRGAREKSPEVRRLLAQEFELKSSEQIMLGRQLNVRSKEYLTVSRLRMLRENHDRSRSAGKLGLISEADLLRLTRLIEDDAIRADLYQERLDEVLGLGARADEDAAGLGDAGRTVMDIWDKMDEGIITDDEVAFDEADRRVRERQTAE